MLTKIKRMFVLVICAAFAFALVGCGDGVQEALDLLELPTEVTEDFQLPSVALEGVQTSWTSDKEVIVVDGDYAVVTRPSTGDVTVTLTGTATLGEKSYARSVQVVVKSYEKPVNFKINAGNLKYDQEAKAYYLIMGKDAQLSIDVADPETQSTEVTWQIVKGTKRCQVSAEGLLTGKDYGEVTVQATSKADSSITDQLVFTVIEDMNPRQVLLNNKKAIEASIDRFVSETINFPMAPNGQVETVYKDANGNELYYGEYVWVEGADRYETLYCVLTYMGEVLEFEFTICVVTDPENNEFLALDYAKEQMDAIFSKYTGANAELVSGDIVVPELFTAEQAKFDVELSYTVVTDYQPYPIRFKNVVIDEELGTEQFTAVYTKPNDDAAVRIEVYAKTANVDFVVRYNVVAAGYTKAEIVEYLTENVLPTAGEDGKISLVCSHMTLPTVDTTGKFAKLEIVWESSNEAVLTAAGKFANPGLEADTEVKLTAKIVYKGTVNETFAFEEAKEIAVVAKPAENAAQSASLQISNFIDAEEFMSKVSYFPFGKPDRKDADGNITNVLPLPKKVSELTDQLPALADLEIVWAAKEEGLLDENYKLLKQYLRYHEVVLTYTVTVGEATAVGEIVINVGITEVKNAVYIGGWFANDQTGGGDYTGDVLSQLSKFDAPVGTTTGRGKQYGGAYGMGMFGGYTYYIDIYEVDAEGNPTDKFTRYQYFTQLGTIYVIDEAFSIAADGTNPVFNETVTANVGSGNNWALFIVNETEADVKVPMSPAGGLGDTVFTDENGDPIAYKAHPAGVARENAFSIDGYRTGFAADSTGKVVFGNGDKVVQNICAVNSDVADIANYWVTVPAGGYAMSYKTQQNNATVTGKFCNPGSELTILYFDPYFTSVDGSNGADELLHTNIWG